MEALILHLQRLSTEDGPGIRTTVFFKGCSLHCEWCHNPESISSHPEVQWIENRCIDCHTCLEACPNHCLQMAPEGIRVDRDSCQGCGTCAEECPANALELLGTHISLDILFEELLKDQAYFEKSGGGVTFSGGEPSLQAHFVAQLAQRLQEARIHTALDTCGFCSPAALERLLPHFNLILYDLKEIDSQKHARFTGQPNQKILDNLMLIQDWISRHGSSTHLWIRTPLIPGATATFENITGIGTLIKENLPGVVERWELCAFNNLCRDKYRRLDVDWSYREIPLLTKDALEEVEMWARAAVDDPDRVAVTGAAQVRG